MKPFFIDDWPNVKSDHNEISNKIVEVFNEHQKKKIKSKELRSISNDDFIQKDSIISLLPNKEIKNDLNKKY